jgi:hypothetical protein
MRNKTDIAAIPVGANLPGMRNVTYQDYLADPAAALGPIQREAQRARTEAFSRHLLAPLARLCGRLLAIRGAKRYLDPRVPTT